MPGDGGFPSETTSRNQEIIMFGSIVGALIDRQDGDSGVEGALWGAVAEKGVKLVFPLIMTFAIGYAVQKGISMAWDKATGEDQPDY